MDIIMSYKVCRLCLLGQEGSVLTPIFGNPSLPELPGKLQKCLPFKIHVLDKYPKHICFRCLAQIDIVYEFLRNAIYADGYWKKLDKNQPAHEPQSSSTSFQRILSEPTRRHENLPLAKRPCLEPQAVFCVPSSSEDSEDDDIVSVCQSNRWRSTRPPSQQQHMVIEQRTHDTKYWVMAQEPSDEAEHSEEPTVKARQKQMARKDCKTEAVMQPQIDECLTTKKEENSQTESEATINNPPLMNPQPTDYTFPGLPLKLQGTDKSQLQFMYSYPPFGFPWFQFMPGGYPMPPQMLAMPSTSQNCFPVQAMQVATSTTMPLPSAEPPLSMTEPPQTTEYAEESSEHAEEEEKPQPKKVLLLKPKVEEFKVKTPNTPKNKVKISSKQSTPCFFSEQFHSDINFCRFCNEILCPNINLFEHILNVHSKKDN